MRNTSIYFKNIEQVDFVLEIRLCTDTWEKIKIIAQARNKSYSWVVRYALFRLIKRKNAHEYCRSVAQSLRLKNDADVSSFEYRFNQIYKKVLKRHNSKVSKHRHRLCLYGADEQFIRLTAALLGCTMTHLVRVALEKHLDSLVVATKSGLPLSVYREAAWYWLGIKLHYGVEFPTISTSTMHYNLQRYEELDYW